jgi:succinyl-diaminopimelate desuccinylase
MSMTPTLELAMDLIRRPSVTPDDAGCQQLMIPRLEALGFRVERLRFGPVDNFWARRGTAAPLFVFAGHTDVVPPGPSNQWDTEPFTPVLTGGFLHGRGAADMKGSLAAMLTATERFVAAHPQHAGSIGFLVTSDEEADAVDGTVKVVAHLQQRGERIDCCLVCEPSSEHELGDTIKIGRRGSLSGQLRVHGTQGHVAYPQRADNPIHRFAPVLAELAATRWDEGNAAFPPTSFQVSNIRAGTGAGNVIPGELEVHFNFRYSTEFDAATLQQRLASILQRYQLRYTLTWHSHGEPFLTAHGELVDAVCSAIREVTGRETQLSTAGGTSDGRFIAPTGAQVVELGPLNATIHKVNEHVAVADLEGLSQIYEAVLRRLLPR